MPSKLEQTVDYIANLDIGTKVSIKSLAKKLSVSEGTAYHAIKRAEQRELVVTLPKAGTTRIQKKAQPVSSVMTTAVLRELADAALLSGPTTPNVVLSRFYVGDNSVEDLRRQLECGGPGAICILGDRPEMMQIAVACGAHLLLTGGARPYEGLLLQAERQDLAVLSTEYSTFHVLNRLNDVGGRQFPFPVQVQVQEWMQPPQFLYLDDLVADGRQIFRSCGIMEIPVVDEERHICGILSAVKALDTDSSQRVGKVYESGGSYQTVQDTDSIAAAVSQLMFGSGTQIFVLKEDRLEGMLTSRDMLKVFQYYNASVGQQNQEYLLELTECQDQNDRHIYTVRLPFSEAQTLTIYGDRLLWLLLSATNRYCQEVGISGSVQNQSFRSNMAGPVTGDLTLSVETASCGTGYYALECEVYSDSCTYARGSFLILPN